MPTQSWDVGESATSLPSDAPVKDKISDFGRSAREKINENRDTAAGGLATAANVLHRNAENLPGGPKVANLAHSAADKLNSTAEYVREHDVDSMMADVERLVRRNPGATLAVAAALGFLVGRAFSGERNRSEFLGE